MSKSKYKRKYNCPYCEYRTDRENLVHHIDNTHDTEVNEEFPSARIVFNLVNKKKTGYCTVCKKESKWNNSAWRYDRICSERCKKLYIEDRNRRMMKVYNTTNLLNSPEHQKKMLANRSISGSYKFKDGNILTYTGSYEKQLLEFLDLILDIPSKDIITPGPVIEYEFEGKKLFWITDLLYIPFNLAFDVKDGGSNKNTHPDMQINRNKQIAKEKAIVKQGKYNYIRLTDNKFEQLLLILLEIKAMLKDTETKDDKIIHINEAMIGTMSSIEEPQSYIISYGNSEHKKYSTGFVKNLMMNPIFVEIDDKIEIKDKTFFKDKYYDITKIPYNENLYKGILESCINKTNITIPEFKGDKIHSGYDLTKFNIVDDIENISKYREDMIIANVLNLDDAVLHECALVTEENKLNMSNILKGHDELIIKENYKGFFIKNIKNGRRSEYYKSMQDIPKYIIEILGGGKNV